jgi:hypothetical protein
MRKLLKKMNFMPDKLVTDDLRSYGAACRDLGISHRHERGRWRNNRAENSHQPTRRRARKMQGYSGKMIYAVYNASPSPVQICERGTQSSKSLRDIEAKISRDRPAGWGSSADGALLCPFSLLTGNFTGNLQNYGF